MHMARSLNSEAALTFLFYFSMATPLFLSGCNVTGLGTDAQSTSDPTPSSSPPSTPMVTTEAPTNASSGIAVTATISATFSETMDPSTLTNSNYKVTAHGGAPISGSVSYANGTATFTPAAPLSHNQQYDVWISSSVQDLSGTPFASAVAWSFTTAAPPTPTAYSICTDNNHIGGALSRNHMTFTNGVATASTDQPAIPASTLTATSPDVGLGNGTSSCHQGYYGYLLLDFGSMYNATQMTVQSGNSYINRVQGDDAWGLWGSNDGTTWTFIVVNSPVATVHSSVQTYTGTISAGYRYYQIVIYNYWDPAELPVYEFLIQ